MHSTHRTNQDCEENFFSPVRGRNGPIDHPSPVECLNTIKAIILVKNPGAARHLHANTIEQDPEEYVSASFLRYLSHDENANGVCERNDQQSEEICDIDFLENYDSADPIQENVANEMTEEFLADYSNDVEVPLSEGNVDGICIHLEIEAIDEIPLEFLEDLHTEMA